MSNLRNNFSLYYDFYMVVLYGGFSNAAKKLYISQSTLSRNVQKLEEQYNASLILRLQNGIQLTKKGEKVYKTIDNMFHILNDKELEVKNEEIIIGTTKNIADYFLKDIIINFINNNKIKIYVKTTDSKTLKKLLLNHEIDIILDYLPFDIDNENENLKVVPIGEFKTCFACSQNYYKNNKKTLNNIDDILKHNLVIPGFSRRRQLLDQFFMKKNVKLNPILEVPTSKILSDLISEDVGVGYFIYDAIKDKQDQFQIIGNVDDYPTNPIGAIYINKFVSKDLQQLLKSIDIEKNKYQN